jgi:hypothetical protein
MIVHRGLGNRRREITPRQRWIMTPKNQLAEQAVTWRHPQEVVDRRQNKPCSDVTNYPATAAFSNSTYKIYAVHGDKKYKCNIFNRPRCGRDAAPADGAMRRQFPAGSGRLNLTRKCAGLQAAWCFQSGWISDG